MIPIHTSWRLCRNFLKVTSILGKKHMWASSGRLSWGRYGYLFEWCVTGLTPILQRPLFSPKVTVWWAISSGGLIGRWFFEEKEVTVAVNTDRYVNMLQDFFPTSRWVALRWHLVPTRRFKQHTLQEHRCLFWANTSQSGSSQLGSHDLAPCDFFLWGFSKSCVYVNRPRNLEDPHPGRNCQHNTCRTLYLCCQIGSYLRSVDASVDEIFNSTPYYWKWTITML